MFCKNCGKRIKPSDSVCPWCGEKQRIEGGNGFWDIVEQRNDTAPGGDAAPASTHRAANINYREASPDRRKISFVLCMCALLISAFALILCTSAMIRLTKLNREIIQAVKKLDLCNQEIAQMDNEISLLNENVSEMQRKLTQAEEDGTDDKATIEVTDSKITIEKQPTDETIELGQYKTVFKITVKDDGLSFVWEKLDSHTNDWIRIDNDGKYEPSYDSDETGFSCMLSVNNADASVLGTYRCVVSDQNGAKEYSNEVRLSQYFKSEENVSLPSPNINESYASVTTPAPTPIIEPTHEIQPTATPTPLPTGNMVD